MNSKGLLRRISEMEREIALLPAGNVVQKKINGKIYYYHRINHNNKRTESYISFEDVDALKEQIIKRKELEKELKTLKKKAPKETKSSSYITYVRTGKNLHQMASLVSDYQKREGYDQLRDYVFSKSNHKVFILYGLRRTGKTTMIQQLFLDMDEKQLNQSAFIQVKSSDTLSDLNRDLKTLENKGYRYVFIDEVTLIEDFIEGAALFSDIYAASGMKIVLSGTDSLGFVFSQSEQLYDRCVMLHTTFIPYREFERVLGIRGIDEYIRYGGTMSMSGMDYNHSIFSTKTSTNEYIDTAIAHNIQHSLKYYEDGGHFRSLYELYEKNELTNAINRVVEDVNHRFTVNVLTKTFRSNDFSISSRNLLYDREHPVDLNQSLNRDFIEKLLMDQLDILNIEDQKIMLDFTHTFQIEEYLHLLDLIDYVDVVHLPDSNHKDHITVITQPGLRYAQASALINSILQDQSFNVFSIVEKKRILDRILNEIRGRMMEDIVLLETKYAQVDKKVFKCQFAVGEYDMVIFDENALTCQIYEIKHSQEVDANQYKHLMDEEKCKLTEHMFGTIEKKCVIYRGESKVVDGIEYRNIEEYLKKLV